MTKNYVTILNTQRLMMMYQGIYMKTLIAISNLSPLATNYDGEDFSSDRNLIIEIIK